LKLVTITPLIDNGGVTSRTAWKRIVMDVTQAIDAVHWPPGSDNFTVQPGSHVNGVVPIKGRFLEVLSSRGWGLEITTGFRRTLAADEDTAADLRPGAFDAHLDDPGDDLRPFVIEWETGNISSSHRAVNKMALGMLRGELSGGLLVLPTRKLYNYLTDRIGNFRELAPYFEMWAQLPVEHGYLGVIAVEYDDTSLDVPLIPKGTDGRALV
jgi:hypothetical protein